jgi:crotonobetainyl-CoA:carnitine CoA-transferase CaiB-like acyl-CoA transferase
MIHKRATFSVARSEGEDAVFSLNLKLWHSILAIIVAIISISSALSSRLKTHIGTQVGVALTSSKAAIMKLEVTQEKIADDLKQERQDRTREYRETSEELRYIRTQNDDIKNLLMNRSRRDNAR